MDATIDPWRQAIDDELVATENCIVDGDDPKAKLRELIDWHVAVALDPAVSNAAQALIDRGRAEGPRPSDFIDGAGIVANDTPPVVVKKLDAEWEARHGS